MYPCCWGGGIGRRFGNAMKRDIKLIALTKISEQKYIEATMTCEVQIFAPSTKGISINDGFQ